MVFGLKEGSISKAFKQTVASVGRAIEKTKESKIAKAGVAAMAIGATGLALMTPLGKIVVSKAKPIITSLIPSTTKGKIIAAVATPVIVGAVTREPTATVEAVISAPGELAQFGGDIATFAADPSIEHAKEIIKESPILSAAAATAGVAAVGAGVSAAVSGALTRAEMREQTEAFQRSAAAQEAGIGGFAGKPIDPSSTMTMIPERATTSISPKRQYKRRTAKITPSVRQSVRVNIINSPKNTISKTIKNYLKERVLIN